MEIIRGKLKKAYKVVVYGPEGIGKSTFASRFPDPLYIDTEGSTETMDVARLPRPASWKQLLEEVDAVAGGSVVCGTLVLDTADWAERLCLAAVCENAHVSGIEDIGYGKGYVYAQEAFGKLLDGLTAVTARGTHVVVTAHAMMRKFEQPDEMGAYDRWELKLTKKIAPLLKEWADMLLFANYRTHVTTTKEGKRKAVGGERVLYAAHHACWDAKNRSGLPDEMPFDFDAIAHLFAPSQAPAQPKPEPKPEPAPAPAPEPPKPEPKADDAAAWEGIPEVLAALLRRDGVTPFELRAFVAAEGFYPMSAAFTAYDPEFLDTYLPSVWDTARARIEQDRAELPF